MDSGFAPSARPGMTAKQLRQGTGGVIPGRREAANPESITTMRADMDSGLAAVGRAPE